MKNTLVEKIRYIKKVTKKPIYLQTVSPNNPNLRIVIFEDKNGDSVQFTGAGIWNAIEEGMLYVKNEIKNGQLKDIDEKETKDDEELFDDEETISLDEVDETEKKEEKKNDNKKDKKKDEKK